MRGQEHENPEVHTIQVLNGQCRSRRETRAGRTHARTHGTDDHLRAHRLNAVACFHALRTPCLVSASGAAIAKPKRINVCGAHMEARACRRHSGERICRPLILADRRRLFCLRTEKGLSRICGRAVGGSFVRGHPADLRHLCLKRQRKRSRGAIPSGAEAGPTCAV